MKNMNIPAVAVHPGELLQHEFLDPLGLTQAALAAHIGVSTRRINEICRGRRAISAETALLLSKALGTTPQFWMNGQSLYELASARKNSHLPEVTRITAVQ
jgi:antitoxin HigA-1